MYKSAIAVAVTADSSDKPFRALAESAVNISALVFEFMYGTSERCKITYIFAIGLCLLGLGLEHAQNMASLQDCPVTSL